MLQSSDFRQSVFATARLLEADLSGSRLEQCIFHEAEVSAARFIGADLTYADFSGARMLSADFSHATLFRTKFHRVEEHGAVFSSRAAALGDDPELLEAEQWQPNI